MQEEIYLLIAKSLDREATTEEQRELDAWLADDPAHVDQYNEMKALWADSEAVLRQPGFNVEAAWEKVASRTVGVSDRKGRTIPLGSWFKTSLAAAALILLSLTVWWLRSDELKTVTAGNEVLALELPDHSRVRLQPGGTLRYPESFSGNTRQIWLEGAAYFDVQRNERQPFIVAAGAVNVEVLGTSFHVSSGDVTAMVAVTSGKVAVTSSQTREQVVLTPGRRASYRGRHFEVVADTNFQYYREGLLEFSGVPFSMALQRVAWVHQTAIRFDSNVDPAAQQQLIEISFKDQDLEAILNELCLITNTRWKKDKDAYLISPK